MPLSPEDVCNFRADHILDFRKMKFLGIEKIMKKVIN